MRSDQRLNLIQPLRDRVDDAVRGISVPRDCGIGSTRSCPHEDQLCSRKRAARWWFRSTVAFTAFQACLVTEFGVQSTALNRERQFLLGQETKGGCDAQADR